MNENIINLEVPQFYPKQIEFLKSKKKYNCYGGARGGGKSFIMRWKVIFLALNNPGIQILLLRRKLTDLKENHLVPLQKMLGCNKKDKRQHIAEFRSQDKEFIFPNGSRIKLGYCDNENDVLQYQGQAYEVICMEEATMFTEFQFRTLVESNRPSGLMVKPIPCRMYFTCNPGGVGHAWVKRLFVSKEYREKEKPEDYHFIQAFVYDNKWLMENDPSYVESLESEPNEIRKKQMLYGDWDVYEGQFFGEFDKAVHVCRPKKLPEHWYLYRALDYGLDMLACLHILVSPKGDVYCIHEIHESNLIVSEAAERIKTVTKALGFKESDVRLTLAPGDLWNRQTQTGRSAADIFYDNGIVLTEVSRDRINGWLCVKELMKIYDAEDELNGDPIKVSKLHIFDVCRHLIDYIPLAQFDENKYNDMCTEPHDITHILDALRYFAIYWINKPEMPSHVDGKRFTWTQDMIDDYYNGSESIKRRMVELYGEINY